MINTKTQMLLNSFIAKPSSSLLIEGNDASGVRQCIDDLSKELLGKNYAGNKLIIESENGKSIGIDVVRELKQRMATIAGKDQPITRMIYIKRAELLTIEAQNGLLKLIEEPVKNTLLVLITDDRMKLLDTIRSRCQTIKLLPITEKQASEYAQANNIDDKTYQRAYLLSGGASELFTELALGENTDLTKKIATAKEFLSQNPFTRLSRQKEFDSTETLSPLLTCLQTIAEAGLHASAGNVSTRWQKMLRELRHLQNLLTQNANTKLVFLRLCVMV